MASPRTKAMEMEGTPFSLRAFSISSVRTAFVWSRSNWAVAGPAGNAVAVGVARNIIARTPLQDSLRWRICGWLVVDFSPSGYGVSAGSVGCRGIVVTVGERFLQH